MCILLVYAQVFAMPLVDRLPLALIQFSEPDGQTDHVGEGQDYATHVWAASWDFDVVPDVIIPRHLTGVRIIDGVLNAQISGYVDTVVQ